MSSVPSSSRKYAALRELINAANDWARIVERDHYMRLFGPDWAEEWRRREHRIFT